jgi:amidase
MKKDNDIHYLCAKELISLLANREISSVELLEETNAVVTRDFEQARQAAKAADEAIARGEQKSLLGLPITVKESFNVVGLPTTWGNPAFKNWYPKNDSLAISRLKDAGAIIIGKTNVSRMLGDWQSYNEIYGTTNNPYDLNLTPGGSSGGSAAALAAGFTSLELGSDFAGSIRVPAHFCGVFGHKPSIHLIPMRGANPPPNPPSPHPRSDFNVIGPLARTTADLTLALDTLAGPDEIWDGKGYKLCLPPPRHQDIKNFRVLVIESHPLCPTAAVIRESINHVVEHLIKLKATVSRDSNLIPDLGEITRTYLALFAAFVAANLPIEEYRQREAAAKMLQTNDTSITSYYLRGCILSHREWENAAQARDQLRQQWRTLYKEFDVVICPIMPTPAFFHDHSEATKRQIEIDGKLFPYNNQFAWPSIATVFGLPATVAPIGHTKKGLPISIQVIGDYLEDYTTIQFASLLEREFGGFSIPNL